MGLEPRHFVVKFEDIVHTLLLSVITTMSNKVCTISSDLITGILSSDLRTGI